jgi:hypothetical protein
MAALPPAGRTLTPGFGFLALHQSQNPSLGLAVHCPDGQPNTADLAGIARRKAWHAVADIGQQTGSIQRL